MRTNVLLLTVDDMNYDSIGAWGNPLPGVSPNIDRLAGEGMLLRNAHVTIAVCQPSRSVLLTGRYPHRNGARGFERIDTSVTTLTEVLARHGYYNGVIGKEDHLAPRSKFAWNEYITTYNDANNWGRDPKPYYEYTRAFLKNADDADKPFFLMANSHDPHRPYVNSEDELAFFGRHIPADFEYRPEDVEVPGFLPDIPEVRREVAQYYSSVRRGDAIIGEVLRALDEAGHRDDTLVLFLSDNGVAMPFAKTNCYLNSTKSPWIVRWPGHVAPGTENQALVSGIDYMPTILDALGIEPVPGMDGASVLSVLEQNLPEHHDTIYTSFFKTARNQVTHAERHYPMRCVQDKRYAYIFNAWSDQHAVFVNESMAGLTFKAMKEAAKDDAAIAERVHMCEYRVKEELYDYQADPNALHNLIDEPGQAGRVAALRALMHEYMARSGDELLPEFEKQVPACSQ